MLVLRDVFRGVRRFDELCADLGMSRAVLTGRLKRLVDAGRADQGARTRSARCATSTG